MESTKLREVFFEKYGNRNNNPVLFFSPGRVNLIGEHTDYNGGYVFPCALNFGTYLLLRINNSNKLSFSTLNFKDDREILITKKFIKISHSWINYPLGVINEFLDKDIVVKGLELLYFGDIPYGAGLSSSASIEMVTAVALNDLFNARLSTLELVKMCQKSENVFVGMNCGIMDQFATGFGKMNNAIFLNCETLSFEHVPLNLEGHALIITNTGKKRGLTDSKYNERRAECEKAVEMMQNYRSLKNLSALTTKELDKLEKFIEDPVVRRRARHIVTENERVTEAVRILKENNLVRFGELMNMSHDSLKDDYEVTGYELDTLVYEGRKLPGVIGTRMTGAGFGGCTVSIIENNHVSGFIKTLSDVYRKKTGLEPEFYQPLIGDGASRIG